MKIKLKTVGFLAACAVIAVPLSGCVSEYFNARKQAIDPPVQVTIRVLDENGQPIPDTIAMVKQHLMVGQQLFCLSILGTNCDKYRDIYLFKGNLGSDGEQRVEVKYTSLLTVIVAHPCRDPQASRRYFSRQVEWKVSTKERELILSNKKDPQNETRVSYLPCYSTPTPFESGSDYY
ncbi:hypothetical protein [Pseudomonas sp. 3A(2025)]